jgi:hypothetical protein
MAICRYRGEAEVDFQPFLNFSGRRLSAPAPTAVLPKNTVPLVSEGGWVSQPVWTSTENLALTRIRTPDCPALNESVFRLRIPAANTEKYLTETRRETGLD